MTDLEDRLTGSLRAAGEDAPSASGLATAARGRARARRRRTALASAAAVVAVVAVAGGVAWLGTDSDPDDAPPQVASDDPPTERVETWHSASVTVPADWGHGSLSTWCIGASEPGTPVVERPGGVVEDILCTPMYGYGVRFAESESGFEAFSPGTVSESVGEEYPAGSWQGWDAVDDTRVLVVAPTRAEAEEVLGSVERVEGVDANGCAPRAPDDEDAADAGTVRLCRYSADGLLEQSEVLTGRDATDAVAALEAAPAAGERMCTAIATPYVLVSSEAASWRVALDACQAVTADGGVRELTSDVLYWVLSPGWSGSLPEGVTMGRLRS